jgi:hypothetical protein
VEGSGDRNRELLPVESLEVRPAATGDRCGRLESNQPSLDEIQYGSTLTFCHVMVAFLGGSDER